MRVGQHVAAARADRRVIVAVVPVADRASDVGPGPDTIRVELDGADARRGVTDLLGDAAWRGRLGAAGDLPLLARRASPGLSPSVVAALPPEARGADLHVVRAYLAPLGLAVAERLGSARVTLDLDDDDAAMARSLGDGEEADAFDRLLRAFAPAFAAVAVASPVDAAAMAARVGLDPVVLPNAVAVPPTVDRDPGVPPTLLYLGNLTYAPNVEGAEILARDVLPAVREVVPGVTATIAGPHVRGGPVDDLRALDGVAVLGTVAGVAPVYRTATAAVVPLRHGTGTRIKVLEAFAHEVPVVCTPVASSGLGVEDGRDVLHGSSAAELAAQVLRLLDDPALVRRLVDGGRTVAAAHAQDRGADAVRAFLAGSSARRRR